MYLLSFTILFDNYLTFQKIFNKNSSLGLFKEIKLNLFIRLFICY